MKSKLNDEQLLACIDSLTGAYNRRAFYRLAEMEILRSRRYAHHFAIAYLDVDNFKTVNDRFGHHAGDALLRDFVKIISANIRETDLLARLGGDEFAILLPETDEAGARKVVHKLQAALSAQWRLNHSLQTASIGVAVFMSVPDSVDEVLLEADRAMYNAKFQGKNQAFFAVIEK